MRTPTNVSVDVAWRILLGVGCVPGAIAIGMRHTIPESPRFIMDISRNVEQATRVIDRYLKTGTYDAEDVKYHNPNQRVQAPSASFSNFSAYFSQRKNLIPLMAVCYSWFIIDVRLCSVLGRFQGSDRFLVRILWFGPEYFHDPSSDPIQSKCQECSQPSRSS